MNKRANSLKVIGTYLMGHIPILGKARGRALILKSMIMSMIVILIATMARMKVRNLKRLLKMEVNKEVTKNKK